MSPATSSKVFIVMLRQPRSQGDPRTDPFWEFGSFGCTGCHGKNLLHPKKSLIREGDRLAFVQGGESGLRLLLVTPPLKCRRHFGKSKAGCLELLWDRAHKPFCYTHAPSLFEQASPKAAQPLPLLREYIVGTHRLSMDAKFASRFRARTKALPHDLAAEIITYFNKAVARADKTHFIKHYHDALPFCGCKQTPAERKRDYAKRTSTRHPRRASSKSVCKTASAPSGHTTVSC